MVERADIRDVRGLIGVLVLVSLCVIEQMIREMSFVADASASMFLLGRHWYFDSPHVTRCQEVA